MKQRDTKRHIPRQDRRIRERVHDPYKTRLKLPDPTVCPDCGAVYTEGRWEWPATPPPAGSHEERCQACNRIHDKYPAGWITLGGSYISAHEEEILNLVRNQEELEKAEHPLHRIMEIDREDGAIIVTTTDIHLPRRIGEALKHAYHGDLDFHYEEEAYSLRVIWTRDEAD